jgi:hypothetical protein
MRVDMSQGDVPQAASPVAGGGAEMQSRWSSWRRWFGYAMSADPMPLWESRPAPWVRTWEIPNERLWLAALLVIALAARVTAAAFFPSIYEPDETFQYWEQGYRLAFGMGIVPWEYQVGLRSLVIPGVIGGTMWLVNALGGDLQVQRLAVQVLLSTASLSIVLTAYFWARRVSGPACAMLAAFVTSFWFEFIYFSAKPLTEVAAAATLFPAAYLLCVSSRRDPWPRIAGGILLGLTLALRFQLAPAIFVVAVASIMRWPWPQWRPQALAVLAIVLASGLLDWVTLGSPFQSIWLNFSINVLRGKADSFGIQPVFWYLLFYANAWPGFVAPMLCLLAVGARRSPLLLLLPLVIVISHSVIGHKEYRFVYPALPFLITLASIGAAELYGFLAASHFPRFRTLGFAVLAGAWLLTSFSLGGQDGFRKNFVAHADTIGAFALAGQVENPCGLGFAFPWQQVPGYSGFGRNVPMYWLEDEAKAEALEPSYNVVVHSKRDWPFVARDFTEIGCVNNACVAKRPGACVPAPDKTLNSILAANKF